jgi:hypothetical protein
MALSANQLEILIKAKDTATAVISKVSKSMASLGRAAGAVGKKITSSFANVGKSLLNLKAGFVALAGAAGIGYAIKKSYEHIDTLGKTASKLGINVESLQKLRFAAEQAGLSQETLDMAMQRFTRRAAEAAKGTGEAKDVLAQMGITLTNFSGKMKPAEELLGQVADKLAKVKDPAEQLRIAFKLFDSEGVAMVNMLGQGNEQLQAMMTQAQELGFVLSDSTVAGVERANDAFNMMTTAMGGVWNKLTASLAPALEKFGLWWAHWVGAFSKSIQPAIEWIGTYMKSIAADFDAAKTSGAAWGQAVMDAFFKVVELAIKAKEEVDAFIQEMGGFEGVMLAAKQAGMDAWGAIKTGAETFLRVISKIESGINSVISAWNALQNSGIAKAARGIGGAIASFTGATSYDVPTGTRASGGGVQANKPYLVGERGAEMFTPSTSGTISPSGGGTTIVNNIYTAATSHGINNALASRADTGMRSSRVGMNLTGSTAAAGFTNLSAARSR